MTHDALVPHAGETPNHWEVRQVIFKGIDENRVFYVVEPTLRTYIIDEFEL